MLEVIGAGNPEYSGQNWGDVWANSPESKQLHEDIENIVSSRRNVQNEEVKDDREYAMPLWTQTLAVTKRSFVAYWRIPDYILVGGIVTPSIIQLFTDDHLGQVHASHLHRPLQHFHILASWK